MSTPPNEPRDPDEIEITAEMVDAAAEVLRADSLLDVPASWAPNIVSFKTYNTGDPEGFALWDAVNDRLNQPNFPGMAEAQARFGEPQLIRRSNPSHRPRL